MHSAAPRAGRPPSRQPLDRHVFRLALLAGFPGSLVALLWLWFWEHGVEVRWTLTVVIVLCWLGAALAARAAVVRPLQVLANLLAALREGDYSVRAAGAGADDPLGAVALEANALADTLQGRRFDAVEAEALLRTVMAEIDVAVFAFDDAERLALVNRGGERLLARPAEDVLGRPAAALGLGPFLRGDAQRTVDSPWAGAVGRGAAGRVEVRRSTFRQEGRAHQLLVVADLSRALREEERQAWQRLVRVLGHEVNNSLTPIKSIARSLKRMLGRQPRAADWDEELRSGLTVIAGRSEALARFMASYARLARLPRPALAPLDVGEWVARVVALEKRRPVAVRPGPPAVVRADGDQMDQLLINLVSNAVDAALETGGGVSVTWRQEPDALEVTVDDEGPGLADTANLFVPFFTTKPNGSGIGLVLSRQIAEAHGGSLTLENRTDVRGCVARLRLPAG